jgi:hypothetical protein
MGNLFKRKVTKNGSLRTTRTTNQRTGKTSTKVTRIKSPSTKKKKK